MHVLRDEREAEIELRPTTAPGPVIVPMPEGPSAQQRRRMLIALGVLLVALTAVVVKDWDFWFPQRPEAQDAPYTPSATASKPATPAATVKAPAATAQTAHDRRPARVADTPAPAAPPAAPAAAEAARTTIPPMTVEVVAGNRHTTLGGGGNSAINLDMSSARGPLAGSVPPSASVTSAADRVHLSQQTELAVTKSVAPNYPMLARQMKVQGAVILQAMISREGSIQELQIVSGPTILADAAREAVKQWRFKPFFQNGAPVETQTKITVNFTISTN